MPCVMDEITRFEIENRRKNAVAGVLIVLGMLAMLFVLAMLGADTESISLPWSL